MRIAYINPNATRTMTRAVVDTARRVLPGVDILGFTNSDGPPVIEGAADGAAAVPGVLARLETARAQGADAIVIACFDDTGLAEAQAHADCPVLGIGQSAFAMAQLLGLRFSVVTSVAAAVPVIEGNIDRLGFAGTCVSIRASDLPVLTIEAGAPATVARLAQEIDTAGRDDGAGCVILGCAGMSALKPALDRQATVPLIDGVAASACLARAAVDCLVAAG
ncbi:MAG: Hydantoin racemase [Rhodobacteraceae bacterium HLUCCA08]|nr:MAG: Hydantoin racemase [Rhodobacteraceae bacterium HLUCCA08]